MISEIDLAAAELRAVMRLAKFVGLRQSPRADETTAAFKRRLIHAILRHEKKNPQKRTRSIARRSTG